jgi:PIF1 helicase.
LVVTATTGTAAFKIKGQTLHSAVGIPIEMGDDRPAATMRVTNKKATEWRERRFLIVDEVSMMDAKVLESVNRELAKIKHVTEKPFGGVNMIFFGDFLQLPSVSHLDLYLEKPKSSRGHHLWRLLNAAVILSEQMRQAEDPPICECLGRLRLHVPTDDDIGLLNNRVGAPIPDTALVPTIVRRQRVRHSINLQRLRHASSKAADLPIVHCKADIIRSRRMPLHLIYRVKQDSKTLGDAILSVIPGAPLMVTKNTNRFLGIVNGAVVQF